MAVIDGTGKVYEAEFDILDNYSKIEDIGRNKRCDISENIIKDVAIIDGKVQLEFIPTEKFNDSLKFMYYVEV